MFNPKQFESKVYALVTQEVNQAMSTLWDGGSSTHSKGIQLQRQIMKALHSVTEETAIQIFYGLLLIVQEGAKKT